MPRDAAPVLPEAVLVGFPARSPGNVPCICGGKYTWTFAVSAANAGIDSSVFGLHAGHKRINSKAVAIFAEGCPGEASASTGGCGDPENVSELAALALQIATDYYLWRGAYFDVTYPGTLPWEYEGRTDTVTYTYRDGEARTRVRTSPLNVEDEDFFHASSEDCGDGGTQDFVWVGTPSGGIPRRTGAVADGGPLVPGSAECEVFIEDDDGELNGTGRSVCIWNYWRGSGDIAGLVLVRAVPRRSKAGCRLVAVQEDCEDGESSS